VTDQTLRSVLVEASRGAATAQGGPHSGVGEIGPDLTDQERGIISNMIMAGRDMAKQRGINESGYKLVFNVEWGGGQRVFHLHMHLIGGWEKGK